MTDFPVPNPAWTSFCQLVQQLTVGEVRRNTFSKWEMELLLDLQMSPIRKSSRPEVLRRYLKTVQRQLASGAAAPVRFSRFYEAETQRKTTHILEALALQKAS